MRRLIVLLGLALTPGISTCFTTAAPPDAREMEAFVDGVMEAQQKAHHFAGAVVVVVRDGQVVLSRGYGYADAAERKPVDPQRTLFRIASNSKMFVWTAVMQLVEQGKLDLHTDVNQYLRGVRVPPAFGQPITLENLMSHTAGFEERLIGLFGKSAGTMRPLPELMRLEMPGRVFAPGKVTAYSNYGTTLAALMVEQVSGIPYEKYLQQRLLDPLGMEHATLGQPVPPYLAANMSKGYRWSGGRWKEEPFEYVPWAPCGGMSVSGEDMARFMMAHLNDGTLGDGRILRADTAQAMRTRLVAFSPKINGLLHGFMEMNWNGEKIYGHGGDTLWFHSLTAMLPERRMGVFVAYNTDSGAAARSQFSPAFFDHYFPSPLPKQDPVPKKDRAALARFAGTYAPARVSESDLTKLMKLMGAVSMSIDPDGYLVSSSEGDTFRWRQIAPLVFEQLDGKRQLVFREDERGEILDACTSPICVVAIQKQPWWGSVGAQYGSLGICLAVLLAAVVGFPIAAVLQRKQPKLRAAKITRFGAWLVSAAFLLGFAMCAAAMREPEQFTFGVPLAMKAALSVWVAATLLSIGLAAMTAIAWRRSWWQAAGRVCLSLVSVAAIGIVAWLYHWNLLGWKY